MLGFTLARLSYLNVGGNALSSYKSGSSPGEWYYFKGGIYRIGLTIHLATILPAGFLMMWQFVPIIRYKALIFHRINGYIVVLLVLVSNVGAVMIVRRAFGGTLETQAGVGTLAIITTVSICLAWYNIKRLQIDQHRAWMLRAMIYLGTIITLRLIMILSAIISGKLSSYYTTMTCGQLYSIYDSPIPVNALYPACARLGASLNDVVVVPANFGSGEPEQIGAAFHISFGMAMWMAIILHVVGVEIYLNLTPREGNRLRQVSYERQMERGFAHPGSAGFTAERFGDAEPYKPMIDVNQGVSVVDEEKSDV